jgi:flagellar hook-basal body complex protein FliE
LRQGEASSLQAVTGKADLTAVTQAVNNAEIALQAVTAVRDRVIAAYQDISKMPI